jgi:hypothetical protein
MRRIRANVARRYSRQVFQILLIDDLKMGSKKPAMPFSHVPLRIVLKSLRYGCFRAVASCFAMRNLLSRTPQKCVFFQTDYEFVVAPKRERA